MDGQSSYFHSPVEGQWLSFRPDLFTVKLRRIWVLVYMYDFASLGQIPKRRTAGSSL